MCKIKSEIKKRLSEQHNIKIDESKPLKKEYDNSFNELDALDQYYIIKVLDLNHWIFKESKLKQVQSL